MHSTVSLPTPMNSRAPGFYERFYICRDTKGYCTKGFCISAKLNRKLDDVLLSNALRKLVLRHPYFCMNFFRTTAESEDEAANGKNFVLRPVLAFRYNDVVRHKQIKSLDETVYEYLLTIRIPVNEDRPTWLLHLFDVLESDEQYLLFSCNHALFDGNSGANFFDDLVQELDAVDLVQQVDTLFDASTDTLGAVPPPCEELTLLYNPPLSFMANYLFKHMVVPPWLLKFCRSYFSFSWPNLYKYPVFSAVPILPTNKCKFASLHFAPNQVKSILAFCRRNNTTLTPFLGACAVQAVEATISPFLGGPRTHNTALIVCGRRYCPELVNETRYGIFVAAAGIVAPPGLSLVRTSQVLANKLGDDLKSRHSFYKVALLKLVNIWEYFKGSFESGDARDSIEISNIGLKNISCGKWSVEDMRFSQSVSSAHITVSTCSTPHGGLNLAVSYHEDMEKYEKNGIKAIDRFVEKFTEFLEACQA